MNQSDLHAAIDEAQRFLNKAHRLRLAPRSDDRKKLDWTSENTMLTAEVKRASMDLTRALAVIRRTAR